MAGLSLPEVAPYLVRLTRLDPAGLVRLRPDGPDTVALWARVPWGVLVTRRVAGQVAGDHCYLAADLLAALEAGRAGWPAPRDAQWRWPVPPSAGTPVESVPAAELVRLGTAAERTLRAGHGRVGERMLRDTLLDHVAIVVEAPGGTRVEVRQRLVQAALRMGFVAAAGAGAEPAGRVSAVADDIGKVTVRTAGGWVGLAARYGAVWEQSGTSLAFHIVR